MPPKYVWNLEGTKLVKVKDIREFNIVPSYSNKESVQVIVYGFFGGKVPVFKGTDSECRAYIRLLTTPETETERRDARNAVIIEGDTEDFKSN